MEREERDQISGQEMRSTGGQERHREPRIQARQLLESKGHSSSESVRITGTKDWILDGARLGQVEVGTGKPSSLVTDYKTERY